MRFLEVAVEVGGWAGVKIRCQHVICGSLMLQLVEKSDLRSTIFVRIFVCVLRALKKNEVPFIIAVPDGFLSRWTMLPWSALPSTNPSAQETLSRLPRAYTRCLRSSSV